MNSEIDKQMMLKFLEQNYPISRVKVNFKFKRGVILEKGIFLLENKSSRIILKTELVKILGKVFSCDESLCAIISSKFLNLS